MGICEDRYPNIKCIARHVRFAHSCSENSSYGTSLLRKDLFKSKRLTSILFGRRWRRCIWVIIHGLMNEYTPEDTVNFGVAASAVEAYDPW